MTEADKEKVEAAAAASVGAGVGGAGGATVGSTARARPASRVGRLKHTLMPAARERSCSASMSRTIAGERVIRCAGVRARASSPRIERVMP